MITFVLPGYSPHNCGWAMETAKNLKLEGEIRPILWEHWDDPEKPFKAERKAQDLIDILLKDKCNLVAKSIGTLVVAYVVEKIPDRINKILLCGIPLNDLREEDKEILKKVFSNFPAEKILCFQNESDPHGTFDQVEKFLEETNPAIAIVSKLRNDHEYSYFADFQGFLES